MARAPRPARRGGARDPALAATSTYPPHGDVVAAARAAKAATRTARRDEGLACVSLRFFSRRTLLAVLVGFDRAQRPGRAPKSVAYGFTRFLTGYPYRLAPRTPRRPPPCPARARPGSRPRARSRVPGDPRPCPRATNLFGREIESRTGAERTRGGASGSGCIEPSAPSSLDITRPRSSRGRCCSSRRRFRHPRRPRTREEPRGARTRNQLAGHRVPAARRASSRRADALFGRRRFGRRRFGRRRQGRHRARRRRSPDSVTSSERVRFFREV